MRFLASRLAARGFTCRLADSLQARSRDGVVRVEPTGLCWSTTDPADFLLQIIPELTDSAKEVVPLAELQAKYLRLKVSRRSTAAVLRTRLESRGTWDSLRSSGDCALSPDEYAVASFLLSRASGGVRLLTDFIEHQTATLVSGRRRYFFSTLGPEQATSTLRRSGERHPRNSYLPRDGILRLDAMLPPTPEEFRNLFLALGEWCYFIPG